MDLSGSQGRELNLSCLPVGHQNQGPTVFQLTSELREVFAKDYMVKVEILISCNDIDCIRRCNTEQYNVQGPSSRNQDVYCSPPTFDPGCCCTMGSERKEVGTEGRKEGMNKGIATTSVN